MIIVGKELNFSGILFLDVDGVLNSEKWFRSSEYREKRLGFEAKRSKTLIGSSKR